MEIAKGQDHITVLKDPPVSDRYVSCIILTIIVQRTSSPLTQAILDADGKHGFVLYLFICSGEKVTEERKKQEVKQLHIPLIETGVAPNLG